MLKDLIKKARSYRRFDHSHTIADDTLRDIVDTARLTPSAANRQLIKYYISNTPKQNELVFPCLSWAAYLEDWAGPSPDQQPTAYIVLVTEKDFVPLVQTDIGIVGLAIQLAATEYGLGGCMFLSVNKNKLKKEINLDPNHEILLVIAIGKPDEQIVITDLPPDGSIKYYRDANGIHYVPKRKLEDIIVLQ